jgi:hypothetical protein
MLFVTGNAISGFVLLSCPEISFLETEMPK